MQAEAQHLHFEGWLLPACVFKNSFVPYCEKERKMLFGLALKMELIQIFFAGYRWKTLVGR